MKYKEEIKDISAETCPACETGYLTTVQGTYETTYADGEKEHALKIPNTNWLECPVCKEVILDDNTMERIEKAKCQALDLLSPNEILSIRKLLQKNQVEMAELLGIGTKTYCRWENGTFLQTRAYDRYLRLVALIYDKYPEAFSFLEDLAGINPKESEVSAPSVADNPWLSTVSAKKGRTKTPWFDPNLAGHIYPGARVAC